MDETWLERLQAGIEADGRSLRAISIASGLGANYLSEVIREGKEPGIDKLIRICAQLNVSVTRVLTGVDVSAESEEMLRILTGLRSDQQETLLRLARQLQEAERHRA